MAQVNELTVDACLDVAEDPELHHLHRLSGLHPCLTGLTRQFKVNPRFAHDRAGTVVADSQPRWKEHHDEQSANHRRSTVDRGGLLAGGLPASAAEPDTGTDGTRVTSDREYGSVTDGTRVTGTNNRDW